MLLARQIKAHSLVTEVVGGRTRNFAPHGLHLDVIELCFVIGKDEVCGQRLDRDGRRLALPSTRNVQNRVDSLRSRRPER